MGFFSSGTTGDSNSLKDAMNEGLRKPYQFTSEADCISDAVQFLDAFCTPDRGIREIMIFNAASSVAGIRDSEIRSCLMGILDRCTRLAPNECIRLTAAEKAILSKVV